MKKLFMIAIAVIMGTSFALAQPGGGFRDMNPEEIAKRQTDRLKEVLDLNDKQEKQVYEINLESNKEMRKLRGDGGGGNPEGMREKFAQMREKQNEKMKEVLTDEQWVKYEKYLEERRERFNQRRRNP